MAISNTQSTESDEQEEIVFEVRNASVRYNMSRGQSWVLNDVDIDIRREEIFAIVGESGSGKSMFASALLDAVEDPGVVSGDITYYPRDPDAINTEVIDSFDAATDDSIDVLDLNSRELDKLRWEHVSMVFQGAMNSFNPTMKVKGHFRETIRAHDAIMAERMDHVRELFDALNLDFDRVMESYPHELSGGMKQRTLIALSLVLEPEVLVMDEPTAALDLLMQRSIISMLSILRDEFDLTIVFITHDLPLVSGIADRIGVMYAFEFVEIGTTEQVMKDAAHPYTRALLRAVPSIDSVVDEMQTIAGSSPDPMNIPNGCSYHPRCPVADDRCEIEEPELAQIEDEHEAACFYTEQAANEIPYSLHSGVGEDDSSSVDERSGGAAGSVFESTDGDPLLSIEDLEVHFKPGGLIRSLLTDRKVRAVDGVDLEIEENDVVALVGESGCGKTTLGKAAIGLQRPTGGSVQYRGQDIWEAKDNPAEADIEYKEIRRSLQIIHQDPANALNSSRRVRSLLADPLKKWRPELTAQDRMETIYWYLEYVDMTPASDYADRYPHQLSGGEKQRIALGRALLMNPDLILADEAVSALDVSLRVDMMDLMLELQEIFDTSYLFISHNLANARWLAKQAGGKIAIMYLGDIVEVGPPDDVLSNPTHPYTNVLRWSTPPLDPDLAKAAIDEQPPVRRIDIPDPENPPSGCKFHTRCEEATEVCTRQIPELYETENETRAACFRALDEHEYWNSPALEGDKEISFTSLRSEASSD